MADKALLKAIVSLYRPGEEKPIERYNTGVKVAEEIQDITRWWKDTNFMFSCQAQNLTREILFLPREHKIHIFELTCNVLLLRAKEEPAT